MTLEDFYKNLLEEVIVDVWALLVMINAYLRRRWMNEMVYLLLAAIKGASVSSRGNNCSLKEFSWGNL